MIVAIIPARGGSKRIPRKNIVDLGGKPLLAWTIDAAKHSTLLDAIYVSTEDDEIEKIAVKHGAKVVQRSGKIAQDDTPLEPVLRHAVNMIPEDATFVVALSPTSPFRTCIDIDRAMKVMFESHADSLFSAKTVRDGVIENGAIYIFRPVVLDKYGNRHGGLVAAYVMGQRESLEIDEPEDLQRARMICNQYPLLAK